MNFTITIASSLLLFSLLYLPAQAQSSKKKTVAAAAVSFKSVDSAFSENAYRAGKQYIGRQISGIVTVRSVQSAAGKPMIIAALDFGEFSSPVINMTLSLEYQSKSATLSIGDTIGFSAILIQREVVKEQRNRVLPLSDVTYYGTETMHIPVYIVKQGRFTLIKTARQKTQEVNDLINKKQEADEKLYADSKRLEDAAGNFDLSALKKLYMGVEGGPLIGYIRYDSENMIQRCIKATSEKNQTIEFIKHFNGL